jgi:hypothetical protein
MNRTRRIAKRQLKAAQWLSHEYFDRDIVANARVGVLPRLVRAAWLVVCFAPGERPPRYRTCVSRVKRSASAGVGREKLRKTRPISLVVSSPYVTRTGGLAGLRGLDSELS